MKCFLLPSLVIGFSIVLWGCNGQDAGPGQGNGSGLPPTSDPYQNQLEEQPTTIPAQPGGSEEPAETRHFDQPRMPGEPAPVPGNQTPALPGSSNGDTSGME